MTMRDPPTAVSRQGSIDTYLRLWCVLFVRAEVRSDSLRLVFRLEARVDISGAGVLSFLCASV